MRDMTTECICAPSRLPAAFFFCTILNIMFKSISWVDMPTREYFIYLMDEDGHPSLFEVYATWAEAQACVANFPEVNLKIVASEHHSDFWKYFA